MRYRILIPALMLCCGRLSLPAQPEHPLPAICLGWLDAAGLPPSKLPPIGGLLQLSMPEGRLLDASGRTVGYIPAVHREAVVRMHQQGVQLVFEVRHQYALCQPGQYLQVAVWARTTQPENLVPLYVAVPDFEEEDSLSSR